MLVNLVPPDSQVIKLKSTMLECEMRTSNIWLWIVNGVVVLTDLNSSLNRYSNTLRFALDWSPRSLEKEWKHNWMIERAKDSEYENSSSLKSNSFFSHFYPGLFFSKYEIDSHCKLHVRVQVMFKFVSSLVTYNDTFQSKACHVSNN